MKLNALDWFIVAATLAATFLPVLYYYRRAGRNAAEFFASGRSAPWWLIGTSMVATTFSTDTPNLVTDFVRTGGVAKNWLWWAFLLTGMTTVFLYARLWRRSGVLTDLEFYELRYGGVSAAFLRGFRALYLGLFFNCMIMATVTLAACKIASVMLGWERERTVVVCAVICIVFGSFSGLWGVLMTDLLQFGMAMVGVVAAAYVATQQPEVGGLAALFEKLGAAHADKLSILPPLAIVDPVSGGQVTNWGALLPLFIIPLAVQWWSVWYPGAEPGGGSYIAQRMLAARSERDALAGTLWFNLAHYALRPWPWIIVALCSLLVFPTLADIERALPNVDKSLIGHDLAYPAMLTRLPHGLLGLLVASLLAAYVSTMTTHMNWGTSYLVLDFYRRFVNPRASEHTTVWLGRAVSAALMVLSALLVFELTTAGAAFQLLLSVGAGTGLVYLLRWFWWRVNAWSEITGMAVSFATAVVVFVANKQLAAGPDAPAWAAGLQNAGWVAVNSAGELQIVEHVALVATVLVTTLAWILVTLLTPPAPRQRLVDFYRRVRPGGPGWRAIAAEARVAAAPDSLAQGFLGVFVGCVAVYSALFGVGSVLYGQAVPATICGVLFVTSGLGLWRLLAAMWRARGTASDMGGS
ncbi:MAG: sodium:solute symporter family protein [Phycisphaerae bacterium]